VAVPYVVFPYVEALIDVFVEPEIPHPVDMPPFVCTTYGTDCSCSTLSVTAAESWPTGAWNRLASVIGFTAYWLTFTLLVTPPAMERRAKDT
jgi:hypothetical protein